MMSFRPSDRFPAFIETLCAVLVFCVAVIPPSPSTCHAQPRDLIDIKGENPEQRKIMQLLRQLESIEHDQVLQATDAFDAAWEMAVRREDPLLNLNTDVQEILEPGQSQLYAGARARLQQIYENATAEFRSVYQQQIANTAQAAVATAVNSSSVSDLTQVILRFQFTKAGQQALKNLIRLRLSRGELLQVALQFGRLLKLQGDYSANSRTQLAVLWWRAGLPEEAVDCLSRVVEQKSGEHVTIAGTERQLPKPDEDLHGWLMSIARSTEAVATSVVTNWAQPLGNYRRTRYQDIGPPELRVAWSAPTFSCVERTGFNPMLAMVGDSLKIEADLQRDSNDTVIPVASPLLANNLLIFRAAANLRAVDRRTGEVAWESFHVDRQLTTAQQAWQKDGHENPLTVMTLQNQLKNHWLRANVGGQLTCDGRTVFAIEEATQETMRLNLADRLPVRPKATNYLRAYNVDSGMMQGQAGGPIGSSVTGGLVNPLAGMYFLGAPLVMGDRIYVIAESDQGIFLLQLKATPLYSSAHGEIDMRPVRSQLLSIPRHPLRIHPLRKYAGIIPSYGRGLLICNTCDEQIIAVSAEDHSVQWVYRYATNVTVPELNRQIAVIGSVMGLGASRAVDMASRWTDCLPRIVGNRILLTPRDSDRLLCLELQTGKEVWSRPRGALRTIVAVIDDRVILTGNLVVECLATSTGKRLWKTDIDEGRVSGTAITNGLTLQIPTSAPSVLTLDIRTGRQLVSQSVADIPGNLLSADGQLYSQSLTSVTCLADNSGQPQSPLNGAHRHLLAGDVVAGEESLKAVIAGDSTEHSQRARDILIETLLESVRLDYVANADRVAELSRLIDSAAPTTQLIVDLAHAMLGLTLVDAADLPAHWDEVNRSQHQRNRLRSLVAHGQMQNVDETPGALSKLILQMLDESFVDRSSFSVSNNIAQRSYRTSAATIRSAMRLRSGETERAVRKTVNAGIRKRIQEMTVEEDVQWWLETCLLAGFVSPVVHAIIDDGVRAPRKTVNAIRDTALLLMADSAETDTTSEAGRQILDSWQSDARWALLEDLAERIQGLSFPHGQQLVQPPPSLAASRYGTLTESAITAETLNELNQSLADKQPAAPWQGTPVVTESPARSVAPAISNDDAAVHRDLPFYGTPGSFGGWTFLQSRGRKHPIRAFDQAGRPRWTFETGEDASRIGGRGFQPIWSTVTARYVLACGNLVAFKIDRMLYLVDGGDANLQQPPRLLWRRRISDVVGEFSRRQRLSRGWERTRQFEMQPSGLFPVGPLTPHGIPIYGSRRLVMLNTFTGQQEWMADGLPDDCKLTATDDDLLLISEATGQVEVRDLVDGTIRKVVILPAWWTDATENVGSSVYTFQPEDGEDLRWRIAVLDGHCLIFRRNTKAAALESYDLSRNEITWSIPLPADSLVSNLVNGHAAVLSDGNRLQIYDILRGARTVNITVPPAPEGMYLYLRSSGGQWVVVTDTFDAQRDDPVVLPDSVMVSGHVYSIRQRDGSLSWTNPIKHQCMRILRANRGPLPPTAPFLTLLQRWFPDENENGNRSGPRRSVIRAKILDVRTGNAIYEDDDVGMGQSFLWIRLAAAENSIELSFDKRIVTFQYGNPSSD